MKVKLKYQGRSQKLPSLKKNHRILNNSPNTTIPQLIFLIQKKNEKKIHLTHFFFTTQQKIQKIITSHHRSQRIFTNRKKIPIFFGISDNRCLDSIFFSLSLCMSRRDLSVDRGARAPCSVTV